MGIKFVEEKSSGSNRWVISTGDALVCFPVLKPLFLAGLSQSTEGTQRLTLQKMRECTNDFAFARGLKGKVQPAGCVIGKSGSLG